MIEEPTGALVIRLRRWAVWFSVVSAFAFAALELMVAVFVPQWSNPGDAVAGSLLALCGAIFGTLGALVLWDSLHERPAVVVKEEGITWGAPQGGNAVLRWEDVVRIRREVRVAAGFVDHRFLMDARPGAKPATRLSLGSRLRLLGRRLFYGTPWVISTFGSDVSVEDLDAILRQHFHGEWASR